MNKFKIKKYIKIVLLYIYAFFIIYMPKIPELLGISSHLIALGLLITMGAIQLINRIKNRYFLVSKNIAILIIGIFLSSIYFVIVAFTSSNELRLLQNNFIIIQILNITIIISELSHMKYNRMEIIKFILNITLIQGIISILMVLFPAFKQVAVKLYLIGSASENIFITSKRIYGISGDYTYFTPIYHGIIANLVCVLPIFKGWKYLLYLPFILITILLNGRTGFAMFIIGTIISYIVLFYKQKIIKKVVKYAFIFTVVCIMSLSVIKIAAPDTYKWIASGVEDTVNLIMYKELEGNYSSLFDEMLYLPEGKDLIIGKGHRVYAQEGREKGYIPSDIGYVNDLFMGGIIYITILYISIVKFIFYKNKNIIKENDFYHINMAMSVSMLIIILISNYKGECMRSGGILLGVVLIKIILTSSNIKDSYERI